MEPSAEGDSRQGNVSGEGLDSAAPKPPQGQKKAPLNPKTAPTKAAARIRPKPTPAKKALKAEEEEVEGAMDGETEEAEPRRQESPPVDEPGSSRASLPQPLKPPTEVLPTATQSQSPGGAREEFSEPQLPTEEDNELPSVSSPLPQEGDGEPAPKRAKPIPEATFTPSAAGVPPKETQEPEITPQMRLIIAEAIAQGIAAGMQQKQQAASPAPHNQGQSIASDNSRDLPVPQRPHCPASSIHTPESLWGDEEQKELMVSEGKKVTPTFTGLFNPALFKTLVCKAKATAGKGADPAASDASLALSDPNSLLFSDTATENQEIPFPQFFLDIIERQWAQPGAFCTPSSKEKHLYNVDPNFRAALEIPTIDGPIVALALPTFLSNNTDDALSAEDRRSEIILRKVHLTASWAVRSALAASFFNRTSLIWLKEMQSRIPATDDQTHQDIKQLIAAAEFSADATLNSAKFASGTIGTSVTTRRLMWLSHWEAAMKYKWKLACAPFKGGKLFGEVLEPLLIETNDKKKVLPSMSDNTYQRPTPYFENPSMGTAGSAYNFTQPHAGYFKQKRGQFKSRGYRGRGRQQFQSNWPY